MMASLRCRAWMDRPAPGLCQDSKGYHGWWSLEAEATVPPRGVQFTAWKPNCGSFPEFLLRSSSMGKELPVGAPSFREVQPSFRGLGTPWEAWRGGNKTCQSPWYTVKLQNRKEGKPGLSLAQQKGQPVSEHTSLSPSIISHSSNKSSENLGVSVEYSLVTNGIINLLFLACLCLSSL